MSTPAPLSNPGKTSLFDRVSWPDIIAGLSLAGLLLPEAVAYSSIANLSPQAGVIALFAGLVCYGLMGTSRFAIVSATSSSAAVLAAASATMAGPDNGLRLVIAVALVLVTGLFFTFAGLARAGSMSAFIAKPVLRGFAFGLAIVIIFKQVASVVGVHPQHSDLVRFLTELFSEIAHWNWAAGAVALMAWGLLLLFARIPRLPGGLLVIVIGIAAGQWLNLAQYGVGLVGTIDLQLTAPTLPSLSYAQWLRIGELSVAMVLILYAESYGSIRSFAMKHGDNVSPNRDLLALGAANLLSGLFHGMPVGAGYSATSANEAAGASSRLAGWCAALILLIVVLTLLPRIALLPEPVLAAIVVQAVSHTLRPAVFRPNFILHRDRLVVIAAVLAVLILGVMDGLLAAIAVSLVMMLRRMSESSVTILGQLNHGHDFVSRALHPDAQAVNHILILRPDTALFFANAERVLAQIRNYVAAAGDTVHTLIISLEESPDLDSSSVEALTEFCTALISEDKHLLFARLKPPVQQVLLRAAIPGLPVETLCALSVDDAVNVAQRLYP
ncbi:SulP family inorganic anion transporter [Pseudomonas sp. 10B1]|uniref:SulP family inorganic anion transporter n=1 Tax=unclassified Pseudomonas TaxID=196821 RepID=UPI002AB34630|nr:MULTISPECIES: SulP family inorganic anion transporter [unclassified Pseudomonas]MDY7558957.1 SulP family inorganic anion transporter [Pseudomonas sp. AB6]MEA9979464.1 SulP family inorganic anion transporter [Pseudomonas sp. RTS4]MEA9997157.1 SulP family inorganic anion transporter [Pseudomonas sp. AA4]MEB0089409.1 SulP family inorganic anion transporter [Pseudomonas sp. RTI1]MEB0124684.1 SulP family inorganic anion transporter [Pseudomonas sp. CCC1.2]